MTAQVFNNGQVPTFYVSQVLTPHSGGGVDGHFVELTVDDHSDLGAKVTSGNAVVVHKTVPGIHPLQVLATANDNNIGLQVAQQGFPGGFLLAEFGANTVETNPSGYAYSFSGLDFKLGANGAEQLRLKAGGIANNNATVSALALASGSTTVYAFPLQSFATFSSVWATTAGFVSIPGKVIIAWSQAGNIVSCQLTAYVTGLALGANTATITLPIARSVVFALREDCSGVLQSFGSIINDGFIAPSVATLSTAIVNFPTATADAVCTIRGAFTYSLS